MAGVIARKAIDHLKSKEFRDYLTRVQGRLFFIQLDQKHTFLGSGSKLGSSYRRHRRHEEEPRDHQWQDDLCSVLLFTALHEVRLQGAATQLASVCLPFDQRISTAGSGKSPHQIQYGEEDNILMAGKS